MGYMLPVSHFQYQDYKNRMLQERQSPYYIDKPYKLTLERTYRDIIPNRDEANTQIRLSERSSFGQYKETLETELTGKGKYVNTHV